MGRMEVAAAAEAAAAASSLVAKGLHRFHQVGGGGAGGSFPGGGEEASAAAAAAILDPARKVSLSSAKHKIRTSVRREPSGESGEWGSGGWGRGNGASISRGRRQVWRSISSALVLTAIKLFFCYASTLQEKNNVFCLQKLRIS